MNMQEAFKQMKSEDKAYGERQQKKNQQVKVKSKNQPNYARMNMQDIMALDDDLDDDFMD